MRLRTFLLSKLRAIAGTVSVALVATGTSYAQEDFDFSRLPARDTQSTAQSHARILGATQDGQPQSRPIEQTPRAMAPAGSMTTNHTPVNVQGAVQPVGHFSSGTNENSTLRLHRLANCDWRQFEYNLLNMWLTDPVVEPLQDGQLMRVQIPATDENTASSMLISRKDSTVYYEGPDETVEDWRAAIQELDRQQRIDDTAVRMISTRGFNQEDLQKVSYMIRVKQQENQNEVMRAVQLPGGVQDEQGQAEAGGPVEGRVIPGLNILVLKGNEQDVAQLEEQIKQFVEAARAAQPQPKAVPLKNLDPNVAAEVVQNLYDNQLAETQGPASITAMQNPKGVLVVGKAPAIKLIEQILMEYDKEPSAVEGDAPREFKTYKLLHMSSVDAKQRVDEYFGQSSQPGVSDPTEPENVLTIADIRANILVVKAAASYLKKVDQLLAELDVADSKATREIRLIKLRNTLATQIAPILQYAINGGTAYAPSQNQQGATQTPQQNANQGGLNSAQRAQTTLQMMTLDREGNEIRSGILFDVDISADEGSNSLIVVAPKESMELIEALAARLDVIPDVETQIKVFQIVNGEALTLIEMLNTLFGGDTQGGQVGQTGGVNSLPLQSASASDGQSLANLRFTYDERTNSIIASGPVGDLEVVKNLLTRLDEEDVNRRQVSVIRLNNAYAVDVADTVNGWLTERTNLITSNFQSGFVSGKREVIVVPETVSNSLIVSALPRYFGEVLQVIESLDRRPPMVKVKVLLAEVSLNALEEFGMEMGVQDSLLFDRGQSIANPLTSSVITTGENLAGTGRASFGVGTVSNDAGYPGFVLSAGNESINLLMRTLKDRNCLRVLSRPHLMTIENLQGRVTVGSNVPRVTGTTVTNGVAQTNITPIDVGVTLEVTPRVSPDGMIVMFVNAINSQLASTGVVVGTDVNGNSIESPIINQTQAQTTIMARHGQTVVFSGLIQETKSKTDRGIPILSGLPVVGPLFGFQSDEARRSELLIILTPYIADNDETIRQQNNAEMDRMHWCMCDVAELHGSLDYDGNQSFSSPTTVYPDVDPTGLNPVQESNLPFGPEVNNRRPAELPPAESFAPMPPQTQNDVAPVYRQAERMSTEEGRDDNRTQKKRRGLFGSR